MLPWDDDNDFGLLRPLMSMVSMAPSLEYLAVEIPLNRGIGPLAESVPSLRNLKVHLLTSPHSCAWHVVQANGDVLPGCKWCQQVFAWTRPGLLLDAVRLLALARCLLSLHEHNHVR